MFIIEISKVQIPSPLVAIEYIKRRGGEPLLHVEPKMIVQKDRTRINIIDKFMDRLIKMLFACINKAMIKFPPTSVVHLCCHVIISGLVTLFLSFADSFATLFLI